jgi:hypothetical protein
LDPGHEDFDFIEGWLRATHGDSQPCHHAVKIRLSEADELLSPAYTIDHVAESVLRQAWIENYGLAEA